MRTRKHENLVRRLFTLKTMIVIKAETNSEDISKYREYIVRLYKTQPKVSDPVNIVSTLIDKGDRLHSV